MPCNCSGGATSATRYQLQSSDGSVLGTYLSRTEALAALAVQPGARVVTVN